MIKIQNLKFKWPGQQENLLDIQELIIRKGEQLFLRGASGSGKSSLLNLLAGINTPQTGSIEILSQPINKLKAAKRDQFRANHIGYIFQMFNLVPYLSLIENVTMPCYFSHTRYNNATGSSENAEEEAKRLLGHLGLSGNAILNKPVTELSVGQQQRVAACRALIGKPEILIADEPTSSLDEDAQKDFINLLSTESKSNGITLVYVSHDHRYAHLFDSNGELKDGKVVLETPKGNGGAK